jgi:hypothetical protein
MMPVVVLIGLCSEQAPSKAVTVRPAMILTVDFIISAGIKWNGI